MSAEGKCEHGEHIGNACAVCEWQRARSLAAPSGWAAVCDDTMPPMDEIVWLWDGQRIWIGGRADDCDGWLWGNTYGHVWHNGSKWDGDLETDDDYKPTHWMRLPEPPND